MLYYDIFPYKKWRFLVTISPKGLRSIDLYENQDLSIYTLDKTRLKPYIQSLQDYFNGIAFDKSLKLDLIGTPFELSVWHALMMIPFGQTKSYKDIANMIHNPKAYQAVGNAVGKNPLLLFIPCHRIIKSDGTIGGFSSDINLKIDLLQFERGLSAYEKTI